MDKERIHNLEKAMTGEVGAMSDRELERCAGVLRTEAERLISGMKIANDIFSDMQEELELRYGGGFAQWVIDSVN